VFTNAIAYIGDVY